MVWGFSGMRLVRRNPKSGLLSLSSYLQKGVLCCLGILRDPSPGDLVRYEFKPCCGCICSTDSQQVGSGGGSGVGVQRFKCRVKGTSRDWAGQ